MTESGECQGTREAQDKQLPSGWGAEGKLPGGWLRVPDKVRDSQLTTGRQEKLPAPTSFQVLAHLMGIGPADATGGSCHH